MERDGEHPNQRETTGNQSPVGQPDTSADRLHHRLGKLYRVDSATPVEARAWPAQAVPGYEVFGLLGSGAFGVVYLGKRRDDGLSVAIKFPRPASLLDVEKRQRFLLEAEIVQRLDHPAIADVIESSVEGPTPYIVSSLCNGPDLAAWLAAFLELQGGPPDADQVVATMIRLVDAVDYAHQQGVVHRDLKPANILLTTSAAELPDESQEQIDRRDLTFYDAKITDFGLAKLADEPFADTRSSLMLGSPAYMAPEQIDAGQSPDEDETAAAADIYSLGVILFELLTGTLPIVGRSGFELLQNIRSSPPQRLSGRAIRNRVGLQKICDACLRKNPDERYATAGDLSADLNRWLRDEPVRGVRRTAIKRLQFWFNRHDWMRAAGSFSIAAQLLIMIWMISTVIACYWVYQPISTDSLGKTLLQTTAIAILGHGSSLVAAWHTLRHRRWAAWAGLILILLILPTAVMGMLGHPMAFEEVYGAQPFFSFSIHFMLVACFTSQGVLYLLAIFSTRSSKSN